MRLHSTLAWQWGQFFLLWNTKPANSQNISKSSICIKLLLNKWSRIVLPWDVELRHTNKLYNYIPWSISIEGINASPKIILFIVVLFENVCCTPENFDYFDFEHVQLHSHIWAAAGEGFVVVKLERRKTLVSSQYKGGSSKKLTRKCKNYTFAT